MNRPVKFLIIFAILLLCSVNAVSADNFTDVNETASDHPLITVNTTEVYFNESVSISLRDSDDAALSNQDILAGIDGKNYTLTTDLEGKADLYLNLKPNTYPLDVFFKGNQHYGDANQTFNISVLKLNSQINSLNTTVLRGDYLKINLTDEYSKAIVDAKVTITVNGRNYAVKTDSNGIAGLQINLNAGKYSATLKFAGNDYYNSVSKTISMIIPATTSLVIGNDRMLTNGYLRIYLRSDVQSAVSNKAVKISIGGKTYSKTTNSEGIIIFKPKLNVGKYNIKVKYYGDEAILKSNASKKVKCIEGNVKSPLKHKIPLKNGVPDIDMMPKNYVMADDDFKYTVVKAEYRNVIKRDSQCLYLYNKLSSYTFFKSKAEPNLYHIIKREKWNVIERAINTKIVLKNKYGYWPDEISVSLKGKSYTYSEVRDVQDTGYTCGPTSCSMCSQALRNYVNEWQFAKKAGTDPDYGSSTKGLKKALEKYNMKCSIYYKSSFDTALKALKKGGCALIFHTWGHFVSILDISKDGKKVLVGNPSGSYNKGSHKIPTKWLTVKYMKKRFNNYDTSGMIVKLKYNLNKSSKNKLSYFYSSMGKWSRGNTSERIPQI